jgi:hypothetical protein
MQLHPLLVSSYNESVQTVIDPILSLPEDVGLRWYDIHAMLTYHIEGLNLRQHIAGYTLRMTYRDEPIDTVVFPIGSVTLPWNGGRVSVKGVGTFTTGGRERSLYHVMILVGPSGWYYLDDGVDQHTTPLSDNELDDLPSLLRKRTYRSTKVVDYLEGDVDQLWGGITTLSKGWQRLFHPTPSELMFAYRSLEQNNLQLVVQWERAHAKWLHHTQRITSEDILHDYLPTPIYFINDETASYRQALMVGVRWWGYRHFITSFGTDPYLTYITWYWASRLLQSHRCQEILKAHPQHTVAYVTHLVNVIECYFYYRRNGQRQSSYKRFGEIYTEQTVDYTPVATLINDYLGEILDKFQFEGFTK